MADSALLLGPILFRDFELPERVRWGGAQRLAVHSLPGGARVIDSLGRDDADIAWCGVFSGSDAALRAGAVDLMRANGGVWPLTWDWFFYSVVIALFEADYARSNWIPYRIVCRVLRDETETALEAVASLAVSVLADLGAARSLGCTVPLDAATTSLGTPQATQPGSGAYASATAVIAETSLQIDTGISGSEASLAAVPLSNGAGLNSATVLAGNLASLTAARGFVARAGVNLATADT